jgi:hypothetical protein
MQNLFLNKGHRASIFGVKSSRYLIQGRGDAPPLQEPRCGGGYSDWLRAVRPKGWSSSPGRVENVHFFTTSRPALGPTQCSIQWVTGGVSLEVNRPGCEADH